MYGFFKKNNKKNIFNAETSRKIIFGLKSPKFLKNIFKRKQAEKYFSA
jgi:hypothetical protein